MDKRQQKQIEVLQIVAAVVVGIVAEAVVAHLEYLVVLAEFHYLEPYNMDNQCHYQH